MSEGQIPEDVKGRDGEGQRNKMNRMDKILNTKVLERWRAEARLLSRVYPSGGIIAQLRNDCLEQCTYYNVSLIWPLSSLNTKHVMPIASQMVTILSDPF